MKKVLNVILPIALVGALYVFLREINFVQKVYQEEYVTRFTMFSSLLTLVFILVVVLVGVLYMRTDRVRILDGIFGLLPSIILLIPVVFYFLNVGMAGSVGNWIMSFLDWTTLSIGGVPLSSIIMDQWSAFAMAGLMLFFAYLLRPRKKKDEEEEEDDYLDDLPPITEKPAKKPAKKPEEKPETVEEPAAEVTPEEIPAEPDPIYAEPEPVAPETPEVIEMPAPEEPVTPPDTPAEQPPEVEKPEAPEI